jgi:hypothetical protein
MSPFGRTIEAGFLVRLVSLLSRPGLTMNPPMVRSGGEERSGATRSHAQRGLQREHGEDGEHRTFPGVSTMAHFGSAGGSGITPPRPFASR